MTIWEWIGGAICVAFPAWVMLVFMILIHYVKKPGSVEERKDGRGFPIEPSKPGPSPKDPPE